MDNNLSADSHQPHKRYRKNDDAAVGINDVVIEDCDCRVGRDHF